MAALFLRNLRSSLAKLDLLVIDDWGLAPLTSPECHDLLEVSEAPSGPRITSQVPVTAWQELIRKATLADAICGRLIHTAYVIEVQGPSPRETRAKAQQASPGTGDAEPPALTARPSGPQKRA